jgi:site-specific recombinase XerD
MEEYLHYLSDKGYSPQTREGMQKTIKRFTKWLQTNNSSIETLTYTQILRYIKEQQQRGVKQRTIQISTGYLKHYFNYLVNTGQMEYNPILSIKIQGVKRHHLYQILSPEELEEIYNSYQTEKEIPPTSRTCPPQQNNYLARQRNKIMLGILIYQGIDVRDLQYLRLQHVKIKQGLIQIPGSRRSNERTLKLEAHQLFDLHDYITNIRSQIQAIRGNTSDLLFISIGKAQTTKASVQKLFKELKTKNKTLLSFNQVRASVISNWLKQHNLRKVQYMAGHRYVSSTERYQQHNIEELQELIDKYILKPDDC